MFPQLQLMLSFSSLAATGDVTFSPPLVSQRHGHLPAHLLQHQHVPGNEHGQQHRQPAAQSQGVQLEPGAHGQLRGGGEAGGSRRRGGDPLCLWTPVDGHHLWDEHHLTYPGSWSLLSFPEQPRLWAFTPINVGHRVMAGFSPSRLFFFFFYSPEHHWTLVCTKKTSDWML